MKENIISYVKKYVGAFGLMGAATFFILYIREHSAELAKDVFYLNLADAFTIPAVVVLMIGVLIWISTTGSFDMFSYGLSRAAKMFIPFKKYDDEKFYDYKMRMKEKRAKGYSFLFIAGGVYLVPAIVFNILYYTL